MSLRLPRFGITSLFIIALGAVLLGGARQAAAYPQFQFSSGTNRCSQCHYSPGGGGLLTSWGRDESGDTISLGGDGAFLHGLVSLPSRLQLGGDFRYAFTNTDVGSPAGSEFKHFPMQGDLYVRGAFTESLSLNVTLGVRAAVRLDDGDSQLGTMAERFMSREHYLMWRPSATGPYVRAGRFFAPYGLRFVEHVYYVRRYTGFNLYEETYNVAGGYVGDEFEAHATVFAPVPTALPDQLRSVGYREYGVAGYGEYRIAKMSALAGQFRAGVGSVESRYQVGGVGKLWVEQAKLLFLGEADLIRQQFNGAAGQNQFVSYLGANLFLTRGLMLGIAYERFQSNLAVRGTGRNAYDFQLNFFPWAHFEMVLLGRYQITGSGSTDGASASLLMLQLHYYL
jgi:hypothetical protein